jgi:tetratricopeptide (TPR) repeat protein
VTPRPDRARLALAAGVLAALALAGMARAQDSPDLAAARNARVAEERGGYATAATLLRELRGRMAPDADLELALALDEARVGERDSAIARLTTPLMDAALLDSLPVTRRHHAPWEREGSWVNGSFDGWHWYVARARAELFAAAGRWDDALEAARLAVVARPLAGKEWHILATCAAHAGRTDIAGPAVRHAMKLDPAIPEASHLAALLAWRDGARTAARELLDRAVALDSTFHEAALAKMKLRLPGGPPALPSEFLTGPRAAGLLTSPIRPKLEEFEQMDTPATIVRRPDPPISPELAKQAGAVRLRVTMLVDEHGRAVLHELPWFEASRMPEEVVGAIAASLPEWRFSPAVRHGEPRRVWATVEYQLHVP